MADPRGSVLWFAANRRLVSDRPYIIAITGSVAKTSTKEAVGAVLKKAFGPKAVRVGFGNLNTYLGLPLAILGYQLNFHNQKIRSKWPILLLSALFRGYFTKLPKYLVLELGADQPGDITKLTEHIKPDIGILTIVGEAHLVNYGSVEELANEKGKLLEAIKATGLAIVNSNDPFIAKHKEKLKVSFREINCPTSEIAVTVAGQVGEFLDIGSEIVSEALKTDWQPTGRMNTHDGKYKIIDDTYNASPLSMKSALEMLKQREGRKVAILGDMLELGKDEAEFHREVGKNAHKIADLVVGVGELSHNYYPDKWFKDSAEASSEVLALLEEGDNILIKGSRGVQMEKVTKALREVETR